MLRVLAVILFVLHGYAGQVNHKFNLSVCAIFKNEVPYLKEWIEYHRLVGVDHFYLYNNGSLDPSRKILLPYIKEKIVTLIHWPDYLGPMTHHDSTWPLSTQLSAYENALKWEALDDTKWLVFLEIDEFLMAPGPHTIEELLEKYDDYPGIILASESYDASLEVTMPQKKFVIESLDITSPSKQNPYRSVQKTILKPELCISFYWPPYRCNFKNLAQAVKVAKRDLRINKYENRMKFQTIDRIKKNLPLDPKSLSETELGEYLEQGYRIKDEERAAYKYLPDLYKKLGYSTF